MSLHDVSYQHWDGSHAGIWTRRWVIASNGLRSCLANKWARHLILVAWMLCLVQVAILFGLGQLLVEESLVYGLIGQLDSQGRVFVSGLVNWLAEHPEISVRTTYNILFFFFATYARFLAMVAVVLVIPHLITRDLSSRAIIIYSSKAVTRFDYFVGKFGTVFGLLCLIWLGPLLTAWIAGNALSSNWHFFWHSRSALFNLLTYVLTAMTVLSLVSMGLSSLSHKPRATTIYWVVFWFAGNAIRGIGEGDRSWLRHFSVSFDLDQISRAIFDLGTELKLAEENVPLFGSMLSGLRRSSFGELFDRPDLTGTAIALAIMVGLAVFVMNIRVKPE